VWQSTNEIIIVIVVANLLLLLLFRVTTCLENLEMSGNFIAVSEMLGILLKVGEMSG